MQGVFCQFFTRDALERIFPLYVRMVASPVTCGDKSYTEYYPIRRKSANADVIAVGIDFSVPGSYLLLCDLITSLKHDANIGTVLVDMNCDPVVAGETAVILDVEDDQEIERHIQILRDFQAGNEFYYEFLTSLHQLNQSYPPQRKMAGGIFSARDIQDAGSVLSIAEDYRKQTGRPVLLITNTENLSPGSEYLKDARKTANGCLCIQCLYAEDEWNTSLFSGNSGMYLVEREKLSFFDDFYALASTDASGKHPAVRFSETVSTDIFFVISRENGNMPVNSGGNDDPV